MNLEIDAQVFNISRTKAGHIADLIQREQKKRLVDFAFWGMNVYVIFYERPVSDPNARTNMDVYQIHQNDVELLDIDYYPEGI